MIYYTHITFQAEKPVTLLINKQYENLLVIDNLKRDLKDLLGYDVTWGYCDYDYLKNREKK